MFLRTIFASGTKTLGSGVTVRVNVAIRIGFAPGASLRDPAKQLASRAEGRCGVATRLGPENLTCAAVPRLALTRQLRAAHEKFVDRARALATFADRPHDQ